MKIRCFMIRTCLITLIVLTSKAEASGHFSNSHTETFIVYLNSGLSLPIGDTGDLYKLGYHFTGGVGIVLSSKSKLSPELNINFSHSQFQLTDSKNNSGAGNIFTDQSENCFSLEGRFRIQNNNRFRPFFTLGIGYTSGSAHWVGDQAFILGGGVDIATSRKGHRLLYSELRLISSTSSYILLSIGLRLG